MFFYTCQGNDARLLQGALERNGPPLPGLWSCVNISGKQHVCVVLRSILDSDIPEGKAAPNEFHGRLVVSHHGPCSVLFCLFFFLFERETEIAHKRRRSRLPVEKGAQRGAGSQDPEIMT